MAEQHIRAVQRQRPQFGDYRDFEILCVIATDIGRDDSPATTSYRGIAERAGCNYNTVMKHVQKLAGDGWLLIEQVGKYNHYQLNYHMVALDINDYSKNCHTGQDDDYDNSKIVTSDYDNHQELSQPAMTILQELSHQIKTISERLSYLEQRLSYPLSQNEGEIVIPDQTGTVTKEKKKEEGEVQKGKEHLLPFPPETWGKTLGELKNQMDTNTFNTWLASAKLVEIHKNGGEVAVAVIEVANQRAAEWLNERLKPVISQALTAVSGIELSAYARPPLLERR